MFFVSSCGLTLNEKKNNLEKKAKRILIYNSLELSERPIKICVHNLHTYYLYLIALADPDGAVTTK